MAFIELLNVADLRRMDIFDIGSYFSSYVPVQALRSPLIKYAACACAAKHLGRVKIFKSDLVPVRPLQTCKKRGLNDVQAHWALEGTKLYDKAISLLMEALQEQDDRPSSDPGIADFSPNESELPDATASGPSMRRIRCYNRPSSDELLTATAILCVYEFLDASGADWARHLNSTKTLLDITEVGLMPPEIPNISVPIALVRPARKLSKAKRAIFWNFAKQDALAACTFSPVLVLYLTADISQS